MERELPLGVPEDIQAKFLRISRIIESVGLDKVREPLCQTENARPRFL